jgi:hypothetical protein
MTELNQDMDLVTDLDLEEIHKLRVSGFLRDRFDDPQKQAHVEFFGQTMLQLVAMLPPSLELCESLRHLLKARDLAIEAQDRASSKPEPEEPTL